MLLSFVVHFIVFFALMWNNKIRSGGLLQSNYILSQKTCSYYPCSCRKLQQITVSSFAHSLSPLFISNCSSQISTSLEALVPSFVAIISGCGEAEKMSSNSIETSVDFPPFCLRKINFLSDGNCTNILSVLPHWHKSFDLVPSPIWSFKFGKVNSLYL